MGRRSRRPRRLARHPPPSRRRLRLRATTRGCRSTGASGGSTSNAATTSTAGSATHRPGLDPVTVTDLTAVEIRDRLDELDAILAAAPPDQTRILDALHTGELTPADLDQAIGDALATQDTRRDWILEHWPHVIEHVELTRLAAQHGPLDHWPLPLPAAAQHLHDQLATVSVDTPEARTLDQLDRELADADPRTHVARLQGQLDALAQQLRDLHTERVQLNEHPDRAADIDHHLAELRRRRRDLDRDLNRYNAKAALWKTGYRPQHLVDAVTRRSHHLAHSAITGGDPWITEAVRAWHASHPDDADVHRLHRVIVEIAASPRTQRPHRPRPARLRPRPRPPTARPLAAPAPRPRHRAAGRTDRLPHRPVTSGPTVDTRRL